MEYYEIIGIIIATTSIVVWVGYIVKASTDISSEIYIKTLCRTCITRRVVALTFDDGPHSERTPKVLDVLKRYGVKATFFVIGEKAEAQPEIVRRIVAEGHLIGNHTYSHSYYFPWMKEMKMKNEIYWCDMVIEKITGVRPTLFRPPFGITNPPLARAIGNHYTVMGWSIRSLDTIAQWSRKRVFERVRRRLCPGSVMLLHDDRTDIDTLMEMILSHLEQNDYKVERIDKLFGL